MSLIGGLALAGALLGWAPGDYKEAFVQAGRATFSPTPSSSTVPVVIASPLATGSDTIVSYDSSGKVMQLLDYQGPACLVLTQTLPIPPNTTFTQSFVTAPGDCIMLKQSTGTGGSTSGQATTGESDINFFLQR